MKKALFFISLLAFSLLASSRLNATNFLPKNDLNTVYRFILGREIKDSEYEKEKSKNLVDVQRSLIDSEEYKNAVSNYLSDAYFILLGRLPDKTGESFWKTRGPLEIYRGIKESFEFKAQKKLEFFVIETFNDIPCHQSFSVLKTKEEMVNFYSGLESVSSINMDLVNYYDICYGMVEGNWNIEIDEIFELQDKIEVRLKLKKDNAKVKNFSYPSIQFVTKKSNKNFYDFRLVEIVD